jgi:hypothetical protein
MCQQIFRKQTSPQQKTFNRNRATRTVEFKTKQVSYGIGQCSWANILGENNYQSLGETDAASIETQIIEHQATTLAATILAVEQVGVK